MQNPLQLFPPYCCREASAGADTKENGDSELTSTKKAEKGAGNLQHPASPAAHIFEVWAYPSTSKLDLRSQVGH